MTAIARIPARGLALGLSAWLCTGAAGCSVREMGDVLSPEVAGSLTLDDEGRVRVLSPQTCQSGDHAYFLGADLVDAPAAAVVRIVMDPLRGPALRISQRGDGAALLVDAEACAGLRVAVRDSGWRVNEYRAVVGEVEADCTLPGGVRLFGRLSFRQCH